MRKSIRYILSAYFVLFSAAILLAASITFGIIQYRTIRQNTAQDLKNRCIATASNLSQEITQMDNILLNAIASREMKADFKVYMDESKPYDRIRARQSFAGVLTALKGLDFSIRQLNVYGTEEGGYGIGNYNGELIFPVTDQSWYEETTKNNGLRFIEAPAEDQLASESTGIDKHTLYFSICRIFFDNFHRPMGYIEVKKYYDHVFSSSFVESDEYTPDLIVYDKDGRQLYPAEKVFNYYSYRNKGDIEVRNTITGKAQQLFFQETDAGDLLVVIAVNSSVFMAPVYRALCMTCIIFILFFGVFFVAANYIAKRISNPIHEIYRFLNEPDEGFRELELENTGILEIDRLKDSLNENIRSKKSSMEQLMLLREQELQAEMLALQSQMNPHFLYNSLSSIAEMAEEGMTGEVAEMCQDITSILRYISSNKEQLTTVEEELEQCDRYLHCMILRYGDELKYSFEIEDELLDCLIPKLCVQLLVENAIKSVTRQSPPWKIDIKGELKGNKWSVTVMDNGPGFDPEVDRKLRQDMDRILETATLPSLKIQGMGILNIFIRLYLHNGIPFVFDFGNQPEGGAFVTVGGYYDKDRPL